MDPAVDPTTLAVADRAPGEALKWVYAPLTGLSLTVALAVALLPHEQALASWLTFTQTVVGLAKSAIAVFWVHAAWSGMPKEQRRGLSANAASAYLCIPFYNLYWMFAFQTRLCDALDRTLVAAGDPRRASRALASTAPTVSVAGSLVAFAAGAAQMTGVGAIAGAIPGLVWTAYMFTCDATRRAAAQRVGVPRERESAIAVWATVGSFLLVAFAGLALWQFLAPTGVAVPGQPPASTP